MKILLTLITSLSCLNLQAQSTIPLMVQTNGMIAAPIGFWSANSNSLLQTIAPERWQPASSALTNLSTFSQEITFDNDTNIGKWHRIIEYQSTNLSGSFDGVVNLTCPDTLWSTWFYVAVNAFGMGSPCLTQLGETFSSSDVTEARISEDGNGHAALDLFIPHPHTTVTVHGYGVNLPSFIHEIATNTYTDFQLNVPFLPGLVSSELTGIRSVSGGTLSMDGGMISSDGQGTLTTWALSSSGIFSDNITCFEGIVGQSLWASNLFLTLDGTVSNTVCQLVGQGSPEGHTPVVPSGSLYFRIDGDSSSVLYVKTGGLGNTGWKRVVLQNP